jgi:NAD dependent epimerase/dehydratase family enzyme
MTRLTRQWEEATEPAAAAGARVCILRTAPVMARGGDTMRILVPMFKLGLGARLGDGSQYFPIVSLRDWVGVAAFAALHEELAGPVNVCCPETPTNAEFTRAFARLVGRPAFLFAPSPLLRLAGPAAPELLRSLNLRPEAATSAGYEFSDRDVTSVLASGLS